MSESHPHTQRFGPALGALMVVCTVAIVGVTLYDRGAAPSRDAAPSVEPAADAAPQDVAPAQAANHSGNAWGPIQPIPALSDFDKERVELGRRLFHDTSLSKDGTISCASCHDVAGGGDDGRARSLGVDGAQGGINAPTVVNARFNFRQFWDGRARTLEDQVDGPLQHPAEMATTWGEVIAKLQADGAYKAAFERSYGHGPDAASVRDAVATFERFLITPGCAFDRYLMGDEGAISDAAKAGYELFVSLGCITCHQGVNVGGNMFQPFGQGSRYFDERGGDVTSADLGRFNVTGDERDKHVFRVAPLRNVALTAPYLHDGSAGTLAEAVQVMASHQLGEKLSEEEVLNIVAFLESLTGDVAKLTGEAR